MILDDFDGGSVANWERLPTPVFWPGEFQGLYSPWGRKESDRTEQVSLSGSVANRTDMMVVM